MQVPFVDLKAQYNSIKSEIDKAITSIIDETSFIGGPQVKKFEQNFAQALGIKHCIGVGNGTDAIYVLLKMLGIGAGDEVITVANSWISTSETISQTGAKPVFVDVDEYFTIDATQIEKLITKKTKAIIPVHLYGQAADMNAIMAIANKFGLPVIEDCAQSHFSKFQNQFVGTFGIASTFSFYPGKNLGAYGDAGGIMTNDTALAEKCRMYANHGALKKHQHVIEGINSRLDSIQAAILNVKLPHLQHWNASRVINAERYTKRLNDVSQVSVPIVRPSTYHTFHLYVIKTGKRDDLKNFLGSKGIETSIHYPTALPLLPCYQYLGHKKSDFPMAFQNQDQILSLPMYPELSAEQIDFICDSIHEFYSNE